MGKAAYVVLSSAKSFCWFSIAYNITNSHTYSFPLSFPTLSFHIEKRFRKMNEERIGEPHPTTL